MQFRQQALDKLRSPEDLELPARLARPQGRLVLSVTLAVMAAASVWAVTGSVVTTVSAPAVLSHGQGGYVLQSPVTGQVTEVLAEEGDRLAARAPVLRVRAVEGDVLVRTVEAGRVTALAVNVGAVLRTGADVAAVEKAADADAPLYATVYVPAGEAAEVREGDRVDLTVQTAPASRYGVLRGEVRSVERRPQSARRIDSFLGDSQLAGRLTEDGAPVAVTVALVRSSSTRSGYAWSTEDGPPFRLDSMTQATASVRVADQHPVDWLLP
ncbi:HlyD family efflux transporter periplasmic adaptor subunit [Streptomyces chilikensis]|uniref:HlyD family efflux transporter periplasmic adaptor subunit n=1 Tax=Streptomyces chilikensis TaxID=1194079 RepID=UPI00140A4C69|nr:HlyD family efflux transporter periplasmic adaptor subunit [Streptomyces chilikensis]